MGEAPGGGQSLAAATTAIADETYPLLDIFPELDQAAFVGFIQQVQTFGGFDRAGVTMFDQ